LEISKVMKKHKIYQRYFKRKIDIFLSFLALIVLSPFLLLVSVLIIIESGMPILFKQKRVGKNNKIFTIYKFRTMKNIKDKHQNNVSDMQRTTFIGKILRALSIDELPELINIIKGDMSIVGPRPLLVQYIPLYNKHQKRRHEVRPGLSGLTQISGRNTIGWNQKFDLDVKYVDNISFLNDMKIIFLTFFKIFSRENVNYSNEETMPIFTGNGNCDNEKENNA
jgi:undecaprenyl phosphate N,N'-diacetylbacillosamine 1-phosphate transferase